MHAQNDRADLNDLQNKNIIVSEKKQIHISDKNIIWEGEVPPDYIIESTGGSVTIKGNVGKGATIKSKYHLTIEGHAEEKSILIADHGIIKLRHAGNGVSINSRVLFVVLKSVGNEAEIKANDYIKVEGDIGTDCKITTDRLWVSAKIIGARTLVNSKQNVTADVIAEDAKITAGGRVEVRRVEERATILAKLDVVIAEFAAVSADIPRPPLGTVTVDGLFRSNEKQPAAAAQNYPPVKISVEFFKGVSVESSLIKVSGVDAKPKAASVESDHLDSKTKSSENRAAIRKRIKKNALSALFPEYQWKLKTKNVVTIAFPDASKRASALSAIQKMMDGLELPSNIIIKKKKKYSLELSNASLEEIEKLKTVQNYNLRSNHKPEPFSSQAIPYLNPKGKMEQVTINLYELQGKMGKISTFEITPPPRNDSQTIFLQVTWGMVTKTILFDDITSDKIINLYEKQFGEGTRVPELKIQPAEIKRELIASPAASSQPQSPWASPSSPAVFAPAELKQELPTVDALNKILGADVVIEVQKGFFSLHTAMSIKFNQSVNSNIYEPTLRQKLLAGLPSIALEVCSIFTAIRIPDDPQIYRLFMQNFETALHEANRLVLGQ